MRARSDSSLVSIEAPANIGLQSRAFGGQVVDVARAGDIELMNIENAESLTKVFGQWPSFHDAEVIRVVLDRSGARGPTLEATIHVFEGTDALDAAGRYISKNDTEVTFGFTGVALLELDSFNSQNVLGSLDIAELRPDDHDGRRFHIELRSVDGVDARFECETATVTSAKAWRPAV